MDGRQRKCTLHLAESESSLHGLCPCRSAFLGAHGEAVQRQRHKREKGSGHLSLKRPLAASWSPQGLPVSFNIHREVQSHPEYGRKFQRQHRHISGRILELLHLPRVPLALTFCCCVSFLQLIFFSRRVFHFLVPFHPALGPDLVLPSCKIPLTCDWGAEQTRTERSG